MRGALSEYLRRRRSALVQPYLKGDVLDIGCGPATIAECLEPSQRYVGVEIQAGYITHLYTRFPQHTFIQRDVDSEPLSLGNLQFDTVLMVAVIEHLSAPERVIVEVQSYMKPSCSLVISTPTALGSAIQQLGAKIGLFSREAAVAHNRVYGRWQLADLLAKCGMRVVLHRTFELGANQLCVAAPS